MRNGGVRGKGGRSGEKDKEIKGIKAELNEIRYGGINYTSARGHRVYLPQFVHVQSQGWIMQLEYSVKADLRAIDR